MIKLDLAKLVKSKSMLRFLSWYKGQYKEIKIENFLVLDFKYQLGIFIDFFATEYNICINADSASYICYYHSVKQATSKIIQNKTIYIKEYTEEQELTVFELYAKGIDFLFMYCGETPF